MKNEVHSFFNTTDNYLHKNFGVKVRAEILKDLIGTPEGKNILDAGCGDGGISMQFLPKNEITFLDLSENMLNLVREKIPEQLISKSTCIKSSLEDYNAEKSYDFIFAIGLISHVPDVTSTIKKMKSLLSTNGVLVIQFSNYNSWITRLKIRIAKNYNYKINKLKYEEFRQAVVSNGFKIDSEVQYSFLFPGIGKLPNKILYWFTKFTYSNRLLSKVGTDFIWVLTSKP